MDCFVQLKSFLLKISVIVDIKMMKIFHNVSLSVVLFFLNRIWNGIVERYFVA